jgi:ABC-type dipeptide/oligopeptide/nickel transport system permease component
MRYPFFRALSKFLKQVLSVVVRAFVITLVLGVCAMAMMLFLGMPIPSVTQVWHGLGGVSKLARVFS